MSPKTQELLRTTLPKHNESGRKELFEKKKLVCSSILLVLLHDLQQNAV